MSYEFIRYDVSDAVATITLNRPDVLNSVNRPMAAELRDAFAGAADDAVRAVLLTGAGRAFCAGQDLAEAMPQDGTPAPRIEDLVRGSYNPIVLAIHALAKPVVAAVNGVAAGAGANLALACDIVLAADSASFIQAFSKIGLVPDTGGTFSLPRLVGVARATALTMLGDKVAAADAQAMGMIWRAVPADRLAGEAAALTRHLATQPTRALGLIKRLMRESATNDLAGQLDREAEAQAEAGGTEDYREGVAAFLGRRAAQFKGS